MRGRQLVFKNIYKLHTYVGLFVAIHFAVFALSGLVLLFKDEFLPQVDSVPTAIANQPTSTPVAYREILAQVQMDFPGDRPLAFFPDEESTSVVQVRLGRAGSTQLRGAIKVTYDFKSGQRLLQPREKATGFFDWTLRLHRELFLGANGKLYVGFIGLLYVFTLVTGFFIYGKFMRGRRFSEIRRAPGLKMIDMHKFLGVVTFGWSLVVGASGIMLAFNGALIKYFQYQSLKDLTAVYRAFPAAGAAGGGAAGGGAAGGGATNLFAALNVFGQSFPAHEISYISFPDTEFGIPGHYLFLAHPAQGLASRLSELFVFDAQTALLSKTIELPFYLKAVLFSEPLHFGDYGGIFLKIVWGLFTVCSMAVVILGVSTFLFKRKKRVAFRGPLDNGSSTSFPFFSSSAFLVPSLLTVATIASLVIAVFVEGILGQVVMGLLMVPLLILASGARRD